MGYPRGLLAPDEEIVLESHPHWKALILPVLVLVAAAAIGIGAWIWTASASASMNDTVATIVRIVAGVVALVAVSWFTLPPLIRWRTTHFVITDRRIIFRTGVFTKTGIDIPVARINSVQFRHGFIDRMFRTGTLIIESASDDPLEFDDIPNVERVHAMLYNELFEALDGDGR